MDHLNRLPICHGSHEVCTIWMDWVWILFFSFKTTKLVGHWLRVRIIRWTWNFKLGVVPHGLIPTSLWFMGALGGPIAVLHGVLHMSTIQMYACLYAGAHIQAFLPAVVLLLHKWWCKIFNLRNGNFHIYNLISTPSFSYWGPSFKQSISFARTSATWISEGPKSTLF